MIDKDMAAALNSQLQREVYSASFYLAMSSWCSDNDLDGFANWFRIQSMEEMVHAMKFYDYLIAQGAHAIVPAVDQPPQEFASAEDCLEKTLKHEQKVTKWTYELADLAQKQKDHATNSFLLWFINEQVEEEATAKQYLQKCRMLGNNPNSLFMLDREMASRVFTPPSQGASGT